MNTRKFLTTFLLSASCATAHAAKPQAEYTVTRIAPYISQGFGINNAGATVGAYQFSGAGAHAFFTPGRDYASSIDIGALESFGNSSIANDINDRFQVVGTSDTTSGQRGFLYQRGVLRNVNVFPPANTTATGINNAGQIVGAYNFGDGPWRGYLRAPDGSFRDIGSLPFPNAYTLPEAINRRGQIVGSSGPFDPVPSRTARAFLYERGVMRDLGNLGGIPAQAWDINDLGQVTGSSSLKTPGVSHAFLWQSGRMVDIDGRKKVGQSIGTGINNRGHVVGSSAHLGPFIYRGRKMESLNALIDPAGGYTIVEAQSINDKGQIVGYANQEGATFGFAVRLDPCHAPAKATGSVEAADAAQAAQ